MINKFLFTGKNLLWVIMGVLTLISLGILWLFLRTPDATPEQEQRYAASSETDVPQPTATFDGTPMNFARFILPGTSTPTSIPTATPEPVFQQANIYAPTYEILVPENGGLTCQNGVAFTVSGNSLLVSFSGRTEKISSSDPKFTNLTKWAVVAPINRWGITYWDPETGSGQTNQFKSDDVNLPTWIVDNRECHVQ